VPKLMDQSGGFGAMLLMAHEWANPEATRRSYELIAQHVMPRFQGHTEPSLDAARRASEVRTRHVEQQNAAVAHMTEKYQKELADRG
jgi:limonene 1,2-monooxygenase